MPDRRALGRTLDDILEAETPSPRIAEPQVRPAQQIDVDVTQISPNPQQPRTSFDPEKLSDLAESIKANGLLQPILVRRKGQSYEVVAGERRLRAAKASGLSKVPAFVKVVADERALELALIENLQRQDLNPIERAEAYRRLITQQGLTQEEAARRVGEDRSTFANTLRLLELPKSVQALVSRETISAGHGRALLGLADEALIEKVVRRVIKDELSVRQTERLVSSLRAPATPRSRRKVTSSPHLREPEEFLRRLFGTRITLSEAKGKGKIVIEFFNYDEFDRIMDILRSVKS